MSPPPGSVNRVSDSEVLVRARGLTKRFGDFTAVDDIDFDLHRGEAFGFLGPNGAGKSSTMRMIGCVSPPSGGELTILGGDPVRAGSAITARRRLVPAEGSPRDLITRYCSREVLELRFGPDRHELAADKLRDFPAERAEVLADRILLYVTDGDDALAAVRSTGLEPLTSLVRRGTLEDVFLRLTGRRLEDLWRPPPCP